MSHTAKLAELQRLKAEPDTKAARYSEQLAIHPINLDAASERAEHDPLVGLVKRLVSSKRTATAADPSFLEREIVPRPCRLHTVTANEIKLAEDETHA